MAGKSILLGTSTRYDGGVMTVGVAPAKVTSVALGSHKGAVKLTIGLPSDPNFVTYAIYALDDESLTSPGFPGGSPILRNNASKVEDDTAIAGLRRHYWVVTEDKFAAPFTRNDTTAFYAQSIVPGTSLSLRAGVS